MRQHIATATIVYNVNERLENKLSDFMSHERQIHKDFYVMTQKEQDFAKVLKLLENFSTTNNEKSLPAEKGKMISAYEKNSFNNGNLDYTAQNKMLISDDEYLPSNTDEECYIPSSESADDSHGKHKKVKTNLDSIFGEFTKNLTLKNLYFCPL